MPIEERVEQLEQKVARLTDKTEVRANKFTLEDENGEVYAELGVRKDGPILHMYDESGEVYAELGVGEDGPMLDMYDEKGRTRAQLTVFQDGPGPILRLFDERVKTIWSAPRETT